MLNFNHTHTIRIYFKTYYCTVKHHRLSCHGEPSAAECGNLISDREIGHAKYACFAGQCPPRDDIIKFLSSKAKSLDSSTPLAVGMLGNQNETPSYTI